MPSTTECPSWIRQRFTSRGLSKNCCKSLDGVEESRLSTRVFKVRDHLLTSRESCRTTRFHPDRFAPRVKSDFLDRRLRRGVISYEAFQDKFRRQLAFSVRRFSRLCPGWAAKGHRARSHRHLLRNEDCGSLSLDGRREEPGNSGVDEGAG